MKKIIAVTVAFLICSSASATTNYSGTWQTVWGNNNKVKMSLSQKGDKVVGYYPYKDGYIKGTVNKNGILNGMWKEKDARTSGTFQFNIHKETKKEFKGKYRRGSSGKWKAKWDGKLLTRKITMKELKKEYEEKKKKRKQAIKEINRKLNPNNPPPSMSGGGGFSK